jgi:hypothetical protein
MKIRTIATAALALVLASTAALAQTKILTPAETAKILPASVFFQGQSAPIQGRNSSGLRFSDKSLLLVSLIDTSGYSTQIQSKYQAYLITETPLEIDGHALPPGAYGCGFISGDNFIVMDIGGHDLFTAHSTSDAALHRPMPLQILPATDSPGSYKLYANRNYVTLHAK